MSPSPVSRRVALAVLVAALNLGALGGLMSLSPTAAADGAPVVVQQTPAPAPEPQTPAPPPDPTVIAELVEPPAAPPPPPADEKPPHYLDQVMPSEDFGGY